MDYPNLTDKSIMPLVLYWCHVNNLFKWQRTDESLSRVSTGAVPAMSGRHFEKTETAEQADSRKTWEKEILRTGTLVITNIFCININDDVCSLTSSLSPSLLTPSIGQF